MDPQAALDRFNEPGTCRAERTELAEALEKWLRKEGFAPRGCLDAEIILRMHRYHETKGAEAAERVNELLAERVRKD